MMTTKIGESDAWPKRVPKPTTSWWAGRSPHVGTIQKIQCYPHMPTCPYMGRREGKGKKGDRKKKGGAPKKGKEQKT